MYHDDHDAPPVNPLPPVVLLSALALALPELVFQAGRLGLVGGQDAVGWRIAMVERFGFFDTVFSWMLDNGRYPAEHLVRFVTYPFINASLSSAVFAVVLVLAIGKMVAETFSQRAFAAVFVASTVVGALAYGVFLDTNVPLISAYPAAYGLIGAFTFMLFVTARAEGRSGLQAFSLIGFLLGLQVFFGQLFGGGQQWVADLAGFVTGFSLSFFLAPGGAGRMLSALSKIRRR